MNTTKSPFSSIVCNIVESCYYVLCFLILIFNSCPNIPPHFMDIVYSTIRDVWVSLDR